MQKLLAEHHCNGGMTLPASEMRFFCDLQKKPRFNRSKMKVVISRAEKHLTEEIPLCPASLYIQYVENGNRSNYERVYFKRRDIMLDLALAEAFEKKGRFTEKLMDVVWAIMEESSWTIPAHIAPTSPTHGNFKLPPVYNEERLHAIDLFSAATGAGLAMVYYLCKDALDGITPIICEKLKYLVVERQIKPFLNCVFWWMGLYGNAVNNWNPWIISNILLIDAILVEDPYTRARVVDRAISCVDNFTAHYAPDGGCDEGPNYWTRAGASYFDVLETLYDMTGGKIDIFGDPLVKAICEYEPKMYVNGRRFVNFADCPPNVSPDGSLLRRMGERCGSDILCRFGDTVAGFDDVKVAADAPYRTLRNLMTPNHASDKSYGFRRVWFPHLKVMTARENEQTDVGLFVAMKGGHNAESHNHNDVGNVIVFYNGQPVIIDTGCGAYTAKTFSARRYELWYMQSQYHNVPDIGGVGEHEGAEFHSDDEAYDQATGGVKMQLKNAYLPAAGILSYTRETLLDGKVVRIRDTFSLDGEKEVDLHFLSCVRPVIKGNAITLAQGRVMKFDPRLTAQVEEVEATDGLADTWHSPVLWNIHLRATVKDASFETAVE